jgi:putative MATE family efflux protein
MKPVIIMATNTTNRSDLLGQYNVKKLLIQLAVPATIGMVVNGLYNLVDTLFVGLGAGEIAIGALGIAFPVQLTIIAFGLMVGVGSASVFSRAYGGKDHDQMRHVANTALRLDFVVALFFSVVGFFIIVPMLKFFGATSENLPYAVDYLSIILIGLVPQTLTMVLNNLTRAEGRAKIAMIAMLMGAGLNIVLDPIFIIVLGLGVQGAAIATVMSQIVAFIYIFGQAQSKESELHINIKEWFDFDWKTMWEVLKIGFPTFLRNAVSALLMIFILRQINIYGGTDATLFQSIYSVINRIILFLLFPAFGLVQGLTPIAGFNYGAKNHKRLYDVIIYAMKLVLIYFVLMMLLVQVLAPSIFMAFSRDNNVFFIETGARTFRIITIGFLIIGFQIILGAIYQAFGYPLRALLIALSRQFIIFVPVAIILTGMYDLDGLWYSFPVADLLAGLLSMVMMIYELRHIRNKHQKSKMMEAK